MSINIDISALFSYLESTSNLALTSKEFAWKISSNGFPIMTSKECLCLKNFSFYESLGCPDIDRWMMNKVSDAIKDNKPEYLQLLLDTRTDLEAKDEYEWTALIWAVVNGRTECLKLLLDKGANIEAKDKAEGTALLHAAENGKSGCLKLLLDGKADLEAKNNYGDTALILASFHGKTDCLKLLLGGKANMEAKDNDGATALIVAAEYGETDCLELLLEHGAKVDPETRKVFSHHSYLWADSTL